MSNSGSNGSLQELSQGLVGLHLRRLSFLEASQLLDLLDEIAVEDTAVWSTLNVSRETVQEQVRLAKIADLGIHIMNLRRGVYEREGAKHAVDIIMAGVKGSITLFELGLGNEKEAPEKELARLVAEAPERFIGNTPVKWQ